MVGPRLAMHAGTGSLSRRQDYNVLSNTAVRAECWRPKSPVVGTRSVRREYIDSHCMSELVVLMR